MEVLKCRTNLLYDFKHRVHIKGFEKHFQLCYFKYNKVKRGIAIYNKKMCSTV